MNHSTSMDADISRWTLQRRIDSKKEMKYTLPDGIRLPVGGELRIYSKLGADAAQLSSDYDISSPLRQKLVSNSVISWGMLLHEISLFIYLSLLLLPSYW